MLQRRPGTEESYEATAVHHPPWWRGSLAGCGAGTAGTIPTGRTGDRDRRGQRQPDAGN